MWNVVLVIRLPRVIAAALIGSALALSGGAYQGVFKNPLVSPDLLGVSAGAGVGASIAILIHLPGWAVQTFAFIAGIIAALGATSLPRLMRNRTILMLVLSGIIVSGFMSAIQGILKYIADSDSELPSIVYWLMGSLTAIKWDSIRSTAPLMLPAAAILLLIRWRINLLSLNDIEARALGVNVGRMRGFVIICSTVLTASAVCLSGTIGWVGLIIPHLSRLLVGEDNRRILPSCVLLGASFMVVVDTLARNLTSGEIPLSILTGLIGAPLFVFILIRKRVAVS
jgi:iron complex transport system permease protein